MKKMFVWVVLAGLLVLTTATAFAGEKTQSRVNYAYGASNFGEDACISTHIGFLVQEGSYSDAAGKIDFSYASINFTRYDFCQGVPILNGNGSVPVNNQSFRQRGNLASASLDTTVPITDSLTGQTFNLVVSLVWTANGPQERTINNDHNNVDDTRINFHGVSIIQSATISGSISLDGNNLIAGRPLSGAMGRGQDVTITINH